MLALGLLANAAFADEPKPCDAGTTFEVCKKAIITQQFGQKEAEIAELKANVILLNNTLKKREQDWADYFKGWTGGQ